MQLYLELKSMIDYRGIIIIDKVAKKVTSGIGAVRKIRDLVDPETLISVYNALINPDFDYCSEVWDTMGVGLSNRLQKLQNRAARVIMNFSNDIPGPEALNVLGRENLVTRRATSKNNVQSSR